MSECDATNSFGSIGHSLRAFNTSGDGLTDRAVLSIGLRLPPDLDVTRLLHVSAALLPPPKSGSTACRKAIGPGKAASWCPRSSVAVREAGALLALR